LEPRDGQSMLGAQRPNHAVGRGTQLGRIPHTGLLRPPFDQTTDALERPHVVIQHAQPQLPANRPRAAPSWPARRGDQSVLSTRRRERALLPAWLAGVSCLTAQLTA